MATLTGTFADWLKGTGYTADPSGAGFLDSEGLNASLTGANEGLSNMQRRYENQDYWKSVFDALQSQPGGAGGFTPKSANIPSYQQWLASKGEGYQPRSSDDIPEGEFVSEFYNIPDYSKGNWLEQLASNLPKLMAGGVLGATAGPALMDFAGLGGAGAGGAGDLSWAANLTDAAGGSLAAPEAAGAAYTGLGGAGDAINLSNLVTQPFDYDPSNLSQLVNHELSETIQTPDGKWVNVYGQGTPNAGEMLPNSGSFDTVDEAVAAAQARSASSPTGGFNMDYFGATQPGAPVVDKSTQAFMGGSGLGQFLQGVSPNTWLSAGTNLLGAGIGAVGAQKAAGIQSDAANQANQTILSMFNTNRADLAPWRDVGGAAITRAGRIMEPDGGQKLLEMDPGYAFRLAEGNKAIDRAAAARGMFDSGPTLKSLTRYGQDYASGEFSNAYNRLLALAGMGQTATGQTGQLGQNAATQIAGGQNLAGAANASGYVGASNAITGGLGGFLRNYQEQALLDQILGARRV